MAKFKNMLGAYHTKKKEKNIQLHTFWYYGAEICFKYCAKSVLRDAKQLFYCGTKRGVGWGWTDDLFLDIYNTNEQNNEYVLSSDIFFTISKNPQKAQYRPKDRFCIFLFVW